MSIKFVEGLLKIKNQVLEELSTDFDVVFQEIKEKKKRETLAFKIREELSKKVEEAIRQASEVSIESESSKDEKEADLFNAIQRDMESNNSAASESEEQK